MKKHSLSLIFYFLSVFVLQSQKPPDNFYLVDSLNYKGLSKADRFTLDSILKLYHEEKKDTSRIKYVVFLTDNLQDIKTWPRYNDWLIEYSKGRTEEPFFKKIYANSLLNKGYIYNNYYGDVLSGLDYYQRALNILRSAGDNKGTAMALNNIGAIYNNKGQINIALKYYDESLKIQESINDKKGIAYSLSNIALILRDKGDIKGSIDYYLKSLKLREAINDKKGIASCYNEIGDIYINQGDLIESVNYFEKSLKIYESINEKSGISKCYYNLGQAIFLNKSPEKSIDYFSRSLKICTEINDWHGKAKALNALGKVSFSLNKNEEAKKYFEESFALRKENNDRNGLCYSYLSLANIFLEKNDKQKAYEYGKKALDLSLSLGFPKNIQSASYVLNKIYKEQGKYKEALEMTELYYQTRDSLNSEENREQTLKKDLQYNYEKKETALKEDQAKLNLLNAEEKQQQKIIIISISIGLIFVAVLALVIFRSLWLNKKKNKIITEQKLEVEKQRDIVERQKHLVEEHQKEILDSIRYAKRIQLALLPSKKYIAKSLDRLKK
jgi:tetratricopeptide (TPR) repeat protein